jgi:p-hydroxybenzoate 3-monooxygenase
VSRLYLQVDPDESVGNWPDDRIWDELALRFALPGWDLKQGPVLDKGITPMRSFVSAPMRYGRLFLAGDAAHIVPPTGAKGLNLAMADVAVLAEALDRLVRGDHGPADAYSAACLNRVWRSTHFSWWMTTMLHRSPGADDMETELQLSQLRYVTTSRAAATSLAENYTGFPALSKEVVGTIRRTN